MKGGRRSTRLTCVILSIGPAERALGLDPVLHHVCSPRLLHPTHGERFLAHCVRVLSYVLIYALTSR
jgi:hypothetical protein